MMDNIQYIIADRQYQGAIENVDATLRPTTKFPVPTEEEFQEYLERADLSLGAILDSPIGVFEFTRYAKQYKGTDKIIEFLVQFERLENLDPPDLYAAHDLLNLALKLPQHYQAQVSKISQEFNSVFGQRNNNGLPNQFRANDPHNPQAMEPFPDSNFPAPVNLPGAGDRASRRDPNSMGLNQTRPNSFYLASPLGKAGFVFAGTRHRMANQMEAGAVISSVDVDVLTPTPSRKHQAKKVSSQNQLSKNAMSSHAESLGTSGELAMELQEKNRKRKKEMQERALAMFRSLTNLLKMKAEEVLRSFIDKSNSEFVEMINTLWYSERNMTVNDFTLFRDLGRGAFGVVSGAKTKTTATLTAIKCMNKRLIKGKNAKRLVTVEKKILEILGDVPSNFTIWLKYSFQDKDFFYMAIPLCTGGDLAFHLKSTHGLPVNRVRYHFAEILEGINHLHANGIIYRDLKPDNVIFDAEGHCRISDMGLAVQTNGSQIRGRAGTPGYWAPEVVARRIYSYSADFWSLGSVLYEMLTGICPFSRTNTGMDRNDATIKWEVTFPNQVGPKSDRWPFPRKAKTLIRGLLDRDRNQRFDVDDVREDPFFENLNWFKLQTRQLPPEWVPAKGKIHAADLQELDYQNTESDYKKIKITKEDDIKISTMSLNTLIRWTLWLFWRPQ